MSWSPASNASRALPQKVFFKGSQFEDGQPKAGKRVRTPFKSNMSADDTHDEGATSRPATCCQNTAATFDFAENEYHDPVKRWLLENFEDQPWRSPSHQPARTLPDKS